MQIAKTVKGFLDSVGGSAEGNFKIYEANSRTHIFLKADKLPGAPAVDFSLDLPGDSDKLVAQGLRYGVDALQGNDEPPTP